MRIPFFEENYVKGILGGRGGRAASGLEHVSNSSRQSLKDPGLNPAQGIIIYMDESLHTEFSTNKKEKVPHHGFLEQRLMARSEPLIQEANPHITKLAIGARI